ncbi:MAG: glycosyltransferase, partial [Thermoplasmata archaeon]|nr:glycosyltransferase [Thermoplasmata archaeon]
MKRISVIIPTYNEDEGLEEFLEQFDRQTLPRREFELIVVDGDSTDRTREIA